ncbi:MAG: nitrous oxide-stimulated promoter family protein [Desulfobulbaceae bacterium]|nr:MAG: nitrous oxide-stimulated promoter family protein [Desulfobulbaceae bacterium]
MHPRLVRELKTVKAMIRIYCKAHHHSSGFCEQCSELSEYAERRLANCPFQEHKSTCGKCTVHCYKTKMREKIIKVMRYSGPRMLFHHPFLATAHLVDEKRNLQPEESAQTTEKRNRP